MKRSSRSLIITEMQMETTMIYHLTLVRMAITNNTINNMCRWVCGERGILFTVGGNADCCSPCGKQYGDTSKIKNGSSFWPSNPTSGNTPKVTQNTNLKSHKHPYVQCSVIYNRQDMQAAQASKWGDKTTLGHLGNEILLSHKKEENFTLCNSIVGPREHYAKWNKSVSERQIPHDFTHMWNLMNRLN